MNARMQPIRDRSKLTEYQRNTIFRIATDRSMPYVTRAEKLRKITYCTDVCKFEVLEARLDKELYDCLYDQYFGTVKTPEKLSEPKPIETHNENKRTILDGFTEVEPTKIIEQPKPKREYSKRMSEDDTRKLIHLYLNGASYEDIAARFGRSAEQIKVKLRDERRKGKHKYMFTDKTEQTTKTTEEKFEEIINSVDAGSKAETEPKQDHITTPDELPKAFTATGKGFLSTDSGIKLDEEPITAAPKSAIAAKGFVQFYGDVEIIIRPARPTGMNVSVEE